MAGQGLRRHHALSAPAGEAPEESPHQSCPRRSRWWSCWRTTTAPGRARRPRGARVAKYARGEDYHRVTLSRLDRLAEFLRARGARVAHAYADDGPVPERELAQRAGLGWIGKNTMLIRPGRRLVLLHRHDLHRSAAPGRRAVRADHCGSCTRCLDACPTAAFVEPHVLDATRCISYLTIEQRGPDPRGAGRAAGGLGLRLRHLQRRLSLEPPLRRARRRVPELRPAPPARRGGRAPTSRRWTTTSSPGATPTPRSSGPASPACGGTSAPRSPQPPRQEGSP